MTLVVGIHYGDSVVIAADLAVTAHHENGETWRHSNDAQKIDLFEFGAIAGAGSKTILDGFLTHLSNAKCQNISNVVGHIDLFRQQISGSVKSHDLAITGWFFSGFHAFDGVQSELCLGIYHPGLHGGPSKAFQKGTIEFMGMADIHESDLINFKATWTAVFSQTYMEQGHENVTELLSSIMEDAACRSDQVSAAFTASITDANSSKFL